MTIMILKMSLTYTAYSKILLMCFTSSLIQTVKHVSVSTLLFKNFSFDD